MRGSSAERVVAPSSSPSLALSDDCPARGIATFLLDLPPHQRAAVNSNNSPWAPSAKKRRTLPSSVSVSLLPTTIPPADRRLKTNNSSIVSKRSVERLYSLDNEHQFLRYFVPKPQRRSPIINRGYWVRMQAVDFVVRSFLEEELPAGTRKVVVNLGCG